MSQIDEQEQKALNDEAEEINSRNATPVLEQQAPEEVKQEEVDVATETDTETTETEGEPKKGFQNRVRELNDRAKTAEDRATSLEQKIAELTGSVNPQPGFNPLGTNQTPFNPREPIVAEGEEITATELNRRIADRDARLLQTANASAQLMQRQSEAVSRIQSETSEVVRKYPALDPDSESYNPDLSEAITEATEAHLRANPYSASVISIVAKLMKPYQGAVSVEVGKARENIAKQVSQAALRPSSIHKEEKTAADMSIAELEAKLGVVQS